jgi:hypothetical protein
MYYRLFSHNKNLLIKILIRIYICMDHNRAYMPYKRSNGHLKKVVHWYFGTTCIKKQNNVRYFNL